MKKMILLYPVFLLLFCISSCNNPPAVTLETLLLEMTNRNALSQFPEPYYSCRQFSSYDRATVAPGDKSWFANWDRSMFIRVDTTGSRKEYVMMDTSGPGAIVRFWMTFAGENSGKGILRIYFDGEEEATIQGTALDLISGGALVGAPLSASVSDSADYRMRGHNLYLPLPYASHCKVTYETENIKDFGAKTGGESVYYNINYRTYAPETTVVTFAYSQLEANKELIDKTQRILKEKTPDTYINPKVQEMKGVILPGQTRSAVPGGQNQAIRELVFRIDGKEDPEQALRSTVLTISFDGYTTVQSPVGDFFGTGYQVRPFDTWYTQVTEEGVLTCRWVMPYKKECVVTLENRGEQVVEILVGQITSSPYKWDDNTMYFGSSWHQFTHLETGEFKSNEGDGGPFDINYVTLTGKGVYAGDGLTLFNTVDAWWGEGDEKVYVDGETFPSHIGTGTEDYYGYAWCRPEKFTDHPFIAQPDGSGNFHPGYTVNMRYRSLDGIPFKESLKFDMEMWHWVKAVINFAPITYWYIHPDNAGGQAYDLSEVVTPVALRMDDMNLKHTSIR